MDIHHLPGRRGLLEQQRHLTGIQRGADPPDALLTLIAHRLCRQQLQHSGKLQRVQ